MDSLDRRPVAASADPTVPTQGGSPLVAVAIVVATIAALYYGREILIPFALAVLLSFALAPLTTRLRRVGVPRVPAVLVAVTVAFAVIGALGLLVGSQLTQLVTNLPTYQQNIRVKIRDVQSAAPSGGIVDRFTEMFRELREELEAAPVDAPAVPVVRLEAPEASSLEVLENVAVSLLGPIGTAGIVVIFVIFMLLEREDLRNRLIRLMGGDLYVTTEALDEAARRVSRYLLMQFLVNATYGVPIGVGLYLIGVPNALLWGALATILRFIPYVGPFIAALFPLALSVAVDPGWSMLAWTVALFIGVELISNNVVEPWLYGSSTGISPVAIIMAAIFWTALWGPVGLFLSTPLTVCLAVVGRYVPQLRFLDVMLGNAPVLLPEERFYQRMLAGDPDEGVQIAREFLQKGSLVDFYDEVALPALRLAEQDRRRRTPIAQRRATVTESVLDVIEDLADEVEAVPGERAEPLGTVLCVGGRSGLDNAAATMLAQLLERRGIQTRVLPAEAIGSEGVASVDLAAYELICLAFLAPSAVVQARQVCRRLRRREPGLSILVGLWNQQVDEAKSVDSADAIGADLVATSLRAAVERSEAHLLSRQQARMVPAPIPEREDERLAALKALGVLDTPPEEKFDQITRRLAEAFGAPIALLTLIDEERQFWKSQTGLPEELALAREAPRETSVCGHVVAANEILVIEDVHKDERFVNNPFLREQGIRFYAGAPLRADGGLAIGSLCVIDTVPRTVSESEKAMLQMIADDVMGELARRRAAAGGTEGTEPASKKAS